MKKCIVSANEAAFSTPIKKLILDICNLYTAYVPNKHCEVTYSLAPKTTDYSIIKIIPKFDNTKNLYGDRLIAIFNISVPSCYLEGYNYSPNEDQDLIIKSSLAQILEKSMNQKIVHNLNLPEFKGNIQEVYNQFNKYFKTIKNALDKYNIK